MSSKRVDEAIGRILELAKTLSKRSSRHQITWPDYFEETMLDELMAAEVHLGVVAGQLGWTEKPASDHAAGSVHPG